MDQFFLETLGFSESTFTFVILPTLIFLARICEVSINTLRIIYMLGGRRVMATLLGFFEAMVWLVAIRQIFQHLDNWVNLVTFPAGFAAGILVGMLLEERIAYGKVMVRIITQNEVNAFMKFLVVRGFRYTRVDAEGQMGRVNLLFIVLSRDSLEELMERLKVILPSAFYTIESVRRVNESTTTSVPPSELKLFGWLRNTIKYR